MKKVFIFIVLLSALYIYSSVKVTGQIPGSTPTIISPNSPWGAVATWSFFGNSLERLNYYNEELDFVVNAGISWIKPTYAPLHLIQRPEPYDWREEWADSFVTIVNRHNLNLLGMTWPHQDVKDEAGWINFWNRVVERYDGDNINDMPGLTKPIKYWYICLEPDWFSPTPWHKEKAPSSAYLINAILDSVATYSGGTEERGYVSKFRLYWVFWNNPHIDTLWNPKIYTPVMSFFYNYIKVSANTIHQQDPEAKVCAPGFDMLEHWWVLVKDIQGTVGIVELCYPPPPYHNLPQPQPGWPGKGNWLSFLENVGSFIDIICVHGFPIQADTFGFTIMDSINAWCDAYYGVNKRPVWLTEVGWNIEYVMHMLDCSYESAVNKIADYYRHLFSGWAERARNRGQEDKIFFWAFADNIYNAKEHWGIYDSILGHRPDYDAIHRVIFSNLDIIQAR